MGVFQSLSVVALRQLVGGACSKVGAGAAADDVVKFLASRFIDHSQKLTNALQTANDRAWKALETALAGDSLWQRCKGLVANAEEKAFAQQVRAFLDISPFKSQKDEHVRILRDALKELRDARSQGLLTGSTPSFHDLAKQAGAFARFGDQQVQLDAEWKLIDQTAGELRESCPNLWRVLVIRPRSGQSPDVLKPSILAMAVRYYFRREVETDPELARGLVFGILEKLKESQEQGFARLSDALSRQGQRLGELIVGLDPKIERLEQQIQTLLDKLQQLQGREVRPSDSLSIRSDAERLLVRQIVETYRSLPEQQKADLPGLLNNLGKLQVAAGDFEQAQRDFKGAAGKLQDPKRQAEAHYNAYQAALQRQQWAEALASIRQAIALDAARFAPFPDEYEPRRILGAGGFGVAFLCHHRFMNDDVVVKTLQTEELDANVDRVFNEAQALKRLDHPSIIRVSTCGYADPRGKARPYLAMDYFDGVNLETYVADQGPLSPDELLGIAVPVAEALQAAHARGILHRDVKPANILVRRDAAGWRVKLIDFGLALRPSALDAQASTQGSQAQTTIGKTIAGTLDYAAPEQMGKSPGVAVGAYSDVYGFGKTCYYALFEDPDPDQEDQEEGDLPEDLCLLLRKCIRKDVAKRLPDFAAVLVSLSKIGTKPAGQKQGDGRGPGRREETMKVLFRHGRITAGTEIEPMPQALPTEGASSDPNLFRVRIANPPGRDVIWLADGQKYTLSRLSNMLSDEHALQWFKNRTFELWRIVGQTQSMWDQADQLLRQDTDGTFEAYPQDRHGPNKRAAREEEISSAKAVREVSFQEYVIKELETGTIEVLQRGVALAPVKPVLRELAAILNVALLNNSGKPLNTRQLGSHIIKSIQDLSGPGR